jgi:hypothetical protein
MLIGAWVSGWVVDRFALADGSGHRWGELWYVPAVMAAVVTVLFALLFKDDFKAKGGGRGAQSNSTAVQQYNTTSQQ